MWKLIFAILFYVCCVFAEKSRVCYYRNKSFLGRGRARFTPEHVDPYLCTTINYAFLQINMQTSGVEMTMKEDADVIARLVALKKVNPSLKVTVAIGGWNHENKPRFSNMVHTREQRTTFIKSVIKFLKKHNLDGVSVDWMYPGVRPKNTPATDKFCFTKLLKECALAFKAEFEKTGKRYSLSAYVGATKNKINAGYQVDKMAMYLDRVDVMAHSLWGPWKKGKDMVTGSHTAMEGAKFTVTDVIDLWMKGGMPANKINLVLTPFGRSFQLKDAKENGLGAPFKGPGKPQKHSNGKGIMSYYEICDEEWDQETKTDKSETLTPYASKDDHWVGYDDEDSINYKIEKVVRKLDLNGITFWALDWDDFEGKSCKRGEFPLLKAAVNALTPPAKDYCLDSPCLNNGTCVNEKDGFKCICTNQFQGKTCNKCAKDHAICSMFDDPLYYCGHSWMIRNCAQYCGVCKPEDDGEDEVKSKPVDPPVDEVVIPKPGPSEDKEEVIDPEEEKELQEEIDARNRYP